MSHLMVAISYVTPLNHEDHQYLTTIICGKAQIRFTFKIIIFHIIRINDNFATKL